MRTRGTRGTRGTRRGHRVCRRNVGFNNIAAEGIFYLDGNPYHQEGYCVKTSQTTADLYTFEGDREGEIDHAFKGPERVWV